MQNENLVEEIIIDKEPEYIVGDLEKDCYTIFNGMKHYIFVGAMSFGKLDKGDMITKGKMKKIIDEFLHTPVKVGGN